MGTLYYKCHSCRFYCFLLDRTNCPNCGYPFIFIDKHLKYMRDQTTLEETGVIPFLKKKVIIARSTFQDLKRGRKIGF